MINFGSETGIRQEAHLARRTRAQLRSARRDVSRRELESKANATQKCLGKPQPRRRQPTNTARIEPNTEPGVRACGGSCGCRFKQMLLAPRRECPSAAVNDGFEMPSRRAVRPPASPGMRRPARQSRVIRLRTSRIQIDPGFQIHPRPTRDKPAQPSCGIALEP